MLNGSIFYNNINVHGYTAGGLTCSRSFLISFSTKEITVKRKKWKSGEGYFDSKELLTTGAPP